MAKKLDLLNRLSASKDAQARAGSGDGMLADLMANPDYLRHSSSVINDALKEGFDVLQMPNGDIVTTGTRVVVHNFIWDAAKKKLVKSRAAADKSAVRTIEAAE
jgi:hypothetical protein